MKNNVWFVTGASKGLGLSLVKKLLDAGYRVAATSRNPERLQRSAGAGPERFLALDMRLTDENSVAAAVQRTVEHFGRIDVVVNNAGYGMIGALEELSDEEARANFDVNVFGSLNVIRKTLPYLRAQGSGHIFNVASIGGFSGAFPGFGIYCATKFAMHGFSEALSEEVKPFGIQVTVVSPGYFRTDFLSSNSLAVPQQEMDVYKNVRETQTVHQNSYNGQQPGDPDKASDVMIRVSESSDAPLHLFLGQDAYTMAGLKIEAIKKDLRSVQDLATATGFEM
ncbi:MAG: SDR family oxidoreductase [Bacteroidia bacterium]|nr:SDR family oxidoreductase [Bacteroidia bacterium]